MVEIYFDVKFIRSKKMTSYRCFILHKKGKESVIYSETVHIKECIWCYKIRNFFFLGSHSQDIKSLITFDLPHTSFLGVQSIKHRLNRYSAAEDNAQLSEMHRGVTTRAP